jgi:hypothetical protein
MANQHSHGYGNTHNIDVQDNTCTESVDSPWSHTKAEHMTDDKSSKAMQTEYQSQFSPPSERKASSLAATSTTDKPDPRSGVAMVLRLLDTLHAKLKPNSDAAHDHVYHLHSLRKSAPPSSPGDQTIQHRLITDAQLLHIARDNLSYAIRRLYCKHADDPVDADEQMTMLGTLHCLPHPLSATLAGSDAHKWQLCDGIDPHKDTHWITAPLWMIEARAQHDINSESMAQHEIDTVTYCMLLVHALLRTLVIHDTNVATTLPFEHVYATLLHIYAMHPYIGEDVVVYNLMRAIYTEYLQAKLMRDYHDTMYPRLHAATVVYRTITMQTVYERTLAAQSHHVTPGGLCAQLLLVPFYTGCPRMCQTLFDPAYSGCLRAMTFTNEKELLVPLTWMSPNVTSACTDSTLLMCYANALIDRRITAKHNALLHSLLVRWLRDVSKPANQRYTHSEHVVAAIQTALDQHGRC